MGNLRELADWKWLLAVAVGLMIGGLGIAVVVAVQTGSVTTVWKSPFWWIGWGMVAIAAAFPIWKGWPTIRRIRPRWPFHVPPDPDGKEEGSALKVKAQVLQERVRFLEISAKTSASQTQQQMETLARERDTEVTKLTAELEREQETHRQTQLRSTSLWNLLRYDIAESRTFSPLGEVELVVAHNEMKNVRESLTAAGQGALAIAASLGSYMEGGDERNKVIGRYFGEHRFQPTTRLFERLSEELDTTPRTDYREWLIHYYEAYNELRRTILQMAKFRGCSLSDLDGYREWRVQDGTFLAKVGEIGVMHDTIKAVNDRHKYPFSMPD